MSNPEPLRHNQYYHIYNRGNNGETLFREPRNYAYFLDLFARYLEPVAETYAYCLMSNHFHLMVRIKDSDKDGEAPEDSGSAEASRAFSNLFGTYSKAFNKAFQRTGSLFEKPFKRKLVADDRHFTYLIAYIHHNPQKHGFVDDFRVWPHSSYRTILSEAPTRIQRTAGLDWFHGRSGFEQAHTMLVDESQIESLIADDWA